MICRQRKKGAEANICCSFTAFHRSKEERNYFLYRRPHSSTSNLSLLLIFSCFLPSAHVFLFLCPLLYPLPAFPTSLSDELRLTLTVFFHFPPSVWQQTRKVQATLLRLLSETSILFFTSAHTKHATLLFPSLAFLGEEARGRNCEKQRNERVKLSFRDVIRHACLIKVLIKALILFSIYVCDSPCIFLLEDPDWVFVLLNSNKVIPYSFRLSINFEST